MKRVLVILTVSLFILAGGCFGQKKEEPRQDPPPKKEEPVNTIKSSLTGLPAQQDKGIIAVVVENYKTARPQTGLDKADITYEMLAEGGITRFLLLYSSQEAEVVGPVRSTRPYFVEMAYEWDSVFVHFGGSKDGYDTLENLGIKHIDGIKGQGNFWRDKTRRRPHNAYSSTLDFRKILDNVIPPTQRWDFAPYEGEPDFTEITVNYNRDTVSKYLFDRNTRRYLRFINDKPHVDRKSGKQLTTANIVVQYAAHSLMRHDPGRYQIELTGSGKAEFFLGGKYLSGHWEKKSSGSPTRFYDASGNPIVFTPGNTWVQIFPKDRSITKK